MRSGCLCKDAHGSDSLQRHPGLRTSPVDDVAVNQRVVGAARPQAR